MARLLDDVAGAEIPRLHPDSALFEGDGAVPDLAACEHFAGSEKFIRKAMEMQHDMGPVFDITCDCEDGAVIGQEASHVRRIASLIGSDENHLRQTGVRIHDPQSEFWTDDVDALIAGAGEKVAYITIPKALNTRAAESVVDYIRSRSACEGLKREIPVHILIETHTALAEVDSLARIPGVQVLDFGLMDFISAHRGALGFEAMRSPHQFEHPLIVRAKTKVVAAALAAGVVPSHNVSLDLTDQHATYTDALRARREFGFLRMWSIHPSQIEPILDAMRPSEDDVRRAEDILLKAYQSNWGPISHDGDLHDRATYRYFWDVLKRANAQGVELGAATMANFFAGPSCQSTESD